MSTATEPQVQSKKKPALKPKRKQVPHVQPGDIVQWWRNGIDTNTSLPAVVVRGDKNGILCLNVFTPSGCMPTDGCRHRNDPGIKQAHKSMSGSWATFGEK